MKLEERVKMVKAMEFIARQINDEEVLMGWLVSGVADGDIKYGDLSIENLEEDEATYYANNDEDFSELMACFLRRMVAASKSGGLYCNGVVSK